MSVLNADEILLSRRIAADQLMGWVLLLHLAVCFGIAAATGTWGLAAAVGLPALAVPFFLARTAPGALVTRLAVAVAFMVFSALAIQQTKGMLETHFGIFVLLAILLYYRDWRVLVTAAGVIAVHHLGFNFLQGPGSSLYVLKDGPNLTLILIHAGYVVVETAVLVYMARQLQQSALDSAQVTAIAKEVAQGKLVASSQTLAMDSDATSHSVLAMQRDLRQTMVNVRDEANLVEKDAHDLYMSASQVSSALAAQSQAVDSMEHCLSSFTQALAEIADRAEQARSLATHSGQCAAEGSQVVKSAIGEMQTIAEVIESSSRNVEQLGAQADRIISVVGLIKEIANQTNLLALNAAIEAARAGEQGRGFAVVADEVRKLAERTASATEEIDGMMQEVSVSKTATLDTISHGVARVQSGVELSAKAGESINEINAEAGKVLAVVEEISTLLQQQNRVSRDVSAAIQTMAQRGQESDAAARRSQESTQRLGGAAEKLREAVSRFSL